MVISIVFNADSLRIAKKLSINSEARQQIIAHAYNYLQKEELANPPSLNTGDGVGYIPVATAVNPDHSNTTVSHWVAGEKPDDKKK